MRHIVVSAMLAGVLALTACSNGKDAPPAGDSDLPADVMVDLTSEELAWLSADLPTATMKKSLPIPVAMLPQEDLDSENTAVLALYDAGGVLVGYRRDIFTHVACNGACQAIRFMLVYDADIGFLDVFHPAGTTHDFMKYWQAEHVAFTDADRALLKSLLANPPAELVAVTDTSALVADATATAPTLPVYQAVVVRGAAFTSHAAVIYQLDTQAIITTLAASEAAP